VPPLPSAPDFIGLAIQHYSEDALVLALGAVFSSAAPGARYPAAIQSPSNGTLSVRDDSHHKAVKPISCPHRGNMQPNDESLVDIDR
jgi:hypothetical protein